MMSKFNLVSAILHHISWLRLLPKSYLSSFQPYSLCSSSFKGTMTQWPIQKPTHNNTKTRRTPWRNRHLEEKNIFVFRILYIYNFFNDFYKKCFITALVRSMPCNAVFQPVLSYYSKPHTFSTFFEEETRKHMHLLSPTRPLRSWTER